MTTSKVEGTPMIYGQLCKIMGEVGSISKDRRNQGQGYNFRGVDDVYLAVQELMAKHGVISLPTVLDERSEERQSKQGGLLIYRILKIRYDFYAVDGSSVSSTVIGEGMDSADKASNKAMSVADKYSLLQALKIPTEEKKDPEHDSHDVEPRGKPGTNKPIVYFDKAAIDAGDDEMRTYFVGLAKDLGLKTAAELASCAAAVKGTPMTKLADAMSAWYAKNADHIPF